jgi:hypothetical protein
LIVAPEATVVTPEHLPHAHHHGDESVQSTMRTDETLTEPMTECAVDESAGVDNVVVASAIPDAADASVEPPVLSEPEPVVAEIVVSSEHDSDDGAVSHIIDHAKSSDDMPKMVDEAQSHGTEDQVSDLPQPSEDDVPVSEDSVSVSDAAPVAATAPSDPPLDEVVPDDPSEVHGLDVPLDAGELDSFFGDDDVDSAVLVATADAKVDSQPDSTIHTDASTVAASEIDDGADLKRLDEDDEDSEQAAAARSRKKKSRKNRQ